jgi:hypothetical protein
MRRSMGESDHSGRHRGRPLASLLLARRRPDLLWAVVPVALLASIWVQVYKPIWMWFVLRRCWAAHRSRDRSRCHYHSFPSGMQPPLLPSPAYALSGSGSGLGLAPGSRGSGRHRVRWWRAGRWTLWRVLWRMDRGCADEVWCPCDWTAAARWIIAQHSQAALSRCWPAMTPAIRRRFSFNAPSRFSAWGICLTFVPNNDGRAARMIEFTYPPSSP